MSANKKVYLGDLEKFVLKSILNLGNSAYGVEVRDEIYSRTKKSLSYAAIYTTLERLKNKKMLETRRGEASEERGGRAKLYFSVTNTGRAALERSINDMAKMGLIPSLSLN